MPDKKRKSIYEVLSPIDVSEYIKSKNGKNYLPWAKCWEIVKRFYPHSEVINHTQKYTLKTEEKIFTNDSSVPTTVKTVVETVERPWFTDGKTGWVEVEAVVRDEDEEGEILEEISCSETYPILDNHNKAIPLEQITTDNVNKSLKRGLVKAVACGTGLGLSLYYGEDLPDEVAKIVALVEQIKEITNVKRKLSDKAGTQVEKFCTEAKRKAFPELNDEELKETSVLDIADEIILQELVRKLKTVRK